MEKDAKDTKSVMCVSSKDKTRRMVHKRTVQESCKIYTSHIDTLRPLRCRHVLPVKMQIDIRSALERITSDLTHADSEILYSN